MSPRELSIWAKFLRLFREREVYVRSEGHIRYITLKTPMLMMMAGLVVTVLTTGVVGGYSYFLAYNSVVTVRETLNRTTDSYKFTSKKLSADHQKQLKQVISSSSSELTHQKKNHVVELGKLRTAYEHQLAQFQSSINQINGRMAKNQDVYRTELERLRLVYTSLQKRHTKLEDLMDQGWAPRIVTFPGQSQNDETDKRQPDRLPAPKNTAKIKSKKKSFLNPGELFPKTKPHSFLAHLNPELADFKSIEVSSLKSSMEELWDKQNRTSAQINFSARKRVREVAQILSRLKFKRPKVKIASKRERPGNIGGPFVELTFVDAITTSTKNTATDFASLQPFQKISLLEKVLLELPIRRPLSDLGSISSPFGPRMDPFRRIYAMHRGIDFRAAIGEPVLATAAGVVILKQNHAKSDYGKVLVIRHDHGLSTLYGHLSEFSINVGDRVKPGDVVGKVGNTGRSTGPHLHYEIRVGDSHVDPIDYLEAATYVF